MTYSARVILDSIGPNGSRLTTFELVMPRIVLAEFNTHRMFSRNSMSSRAIPVEKMLERVSKEPFVPSYWGKNQKGMQADQQLSDDEIVKAEDVWLAARYYAVLKAKELQEIGVHKQITNRLLEPFMWHTVVFTATELENFIALRNDKMAAPEIAEPARLLVEAFEKSTPQKLKGGQWHLPFVTGYEDENTFNHHIDEEHEWLYWARISAARCARTTHLTHEGKRDLKEDEGLYQRLILPGHMSPLEHPAKALTHEQWRFQNATASYEWEKKRIPVGNFWGWQQLRKTVANEHNAKQLRAEYKL